MFLKPKLIYFVSLTCLFFFSDINAKNEFTKNKSSQELPTYIKSKAYSKLKFKPIKKAPAQVVSLSTSLLNAEITSIIDKISILPGDIVAKGETLLELNCDDANFKLIDLKALKSVAQSNLALNEYQLSRSIKLHKSKNISEIDLKNDQTEVKVLKANIKSIQAKIQLAEKNVSRCVIKAPFSGVILERFVNRAEMVSIGQQLIKITDPKQSEVLVQLPIGLVDNFSINKLIQQSFFVYRHRKYPVSFRAIIPSLEGRARHQQFRFSFLTESKNSYNRPPLNAFGELEIVLSDDYLPAHLLVKRNGENGIFLYQNNKAKFLFIVDATPGRPFKVSLDNGDIKLIDSTHIITEGMESISDGQVVNELP
jgi:RND family efflux transporter MFP subunit